MFVGREKEIVRLKELSQLPAYESVMGYQFENLVGMKAHGKQSQ